MGYEILNAVQMPDYFPASGEFKDAESKIWFVFNRIENLDANSRDWAIAQGATHWVNPLAQYRGDYSRMRAAKVLKTRVYRIVDEDEYGNAVWSDADKITGYRSYETT